MIILTDAQGRPITRPFRSDFVAGLDGDLGYMHAIHAFCDRVHCIANESFDAELRAGLALIAHSEALLKGRK